MNHDNEALLQPEVLAELGLHQQPFLPPEPEQLFVDEQLESQLAVLQRHLQLSNMMQVICGAPGAGKTCLLLAFLARAGAHMELFVARGDPSLKTAQVLLDMLLSLGQHDTTPESDVESRLARALSQNQRETRPSVLLVDDADEVDRDELRLLLASIALVNERGHDGIRLVLVGRPALAATLAGIDSPLLQPGRMFETLLEPWTELQTEHYLEHRLRLAGGSCTFTPDTIAEIQFESAGVPGDVDIAAAQSLNRSPVAAEHGTEAAPRGPRETASVPRQPPQVKHRPGPMKQRWPELGEWWHALTDRLADAGERAVELTGQLAEAAAPIGRECIDFVMALPRLLRWSTAVLVVLLALLWLFASTGTDTVTRPLALPELVEPAAAPKSAKPAAPTAPAEPAQPAAADVQKLVVVGSTGSEPATPAATRDEQWLTSRPDANYVIQLIGMADRDALKAFSTAHGLNAQATTFATRRQGGAWFVLVLGPYEDADTARAAIQRLDGELRAQSPWIRSIASIKQAIANQTP